MKSLALPAIVLLSVGVVACGGAGRRADPVSQISSSNATATGRSLEGDGDSDYPGDYDNDNNSNDEDSDTDGYNSYKNNHNGYYDNDDNRIRTSGHAASAVDQRAIATLIEHYYAMVTTGDVVRACSMIVPALAKAIPENYGRAPGPAYLRGAKTCQAVMWLLVEHIHSQLVARIEVTGVRVEGNLARALLGSRTMPASVIVVEREGGVWKIDALTGAPLP